MPRLAPRLADRGCVPANRAGLACQVDAYELAGDICMTALLGGTVGWMTGSLSRARWDYLLAWCGRASRGAQPGTTLHVSLPVAVSAPGLSWQTHPTPHSPPARQAALALLGRSHGHSPRVFGAE